MGLAELRIDGLVVMRRATVTPGSGFSVLTGETGAGKSVCIAALRLALGGRAEGDLISPGCDKARVAAVFDAVSDEVRERLEVAGIDPGDDVLTLARELVREGRGTCRINGALVSLAVMRDIGDLLVDVTAQGASQRVVRGPWQRDLLDTCGGAQLRAARKATAAAVSAWHEAQAAMASARRLADSGAAEIARARDTITDLDPIHLRLGEDAELAAEVMLLRAAAAVTAGAAALHSAAAGDGGAADIVAAAMAQLSDNAGIDVVDDLVGSAADIVERLRDLGVVARRTAEAVVHDDARLASVEERLDVLARVRRRFGSIDEAITALRSAEELVDAAAGGADLEALENAAAAAADAAGRGATELSAARRLAARTLEKAVGAELAGLEMADARFRVTLTTSPDSAGVLHDGVRVRCSLHGIDDVQFRLATNAGAIPVPLDEGPSGGELSRLALALRAVTASEDAATVVLDEIDTGVGGETAARIGDLLSRTAQAQQVIAVTHRPEIAARATTHLLAVKATAAGVTTTEVTEVTGAERIDEMARLMSGRVTAAARARAAELLEEGAATSTPPAIRTIRPHG